MREIGLCKVLLLSLFLNFHFSSDVIKYSFISSPVELGVAHMPNLFFIVAGTKKVKMTSLSVPLKDTIKVLKFAVFHWKLYFFYERIFFPQIC